MSARADAIILSRAQIMRALDVTRQLERDLVNAALSHASASLDDAAAYLNEVDKSLDRLGKCVEQCRISIGVEWERAQPTMSEEVAA